MNTLEPDWGDRLRKQMEELGYSQHDEVGPETGFIDSDGRAIQMGPPGTRGEDHRQVVPDRDDMRKHGWPAEIIKDVDEGSRTSALFEAMKRSRLVRVNMGRGFLHVQHVHPLTFRQKQAIKDAAIIHKPKEVMVFNGRDSDGDESGWQDLRLARVPEGDIGPRTKFSDYGIQKKDPEPDLSQYPSGTVEMYQQAKAGDTGAALILADLLDERGHNDLADRIRAMGGHATKTAFVNQSKHWLSQIVPLIAAKYDQRSAGEPLDYPIFERAYGRGGRVRGFPKNFALANAHNETGEQDAEGYQPDSGGDPDYKSYVFGHWHPNPSDLPVFSLGYADQPRGSTTLRIRGANRNNHRFPDYHSAKKFMTDAIQHEHENNRPTSKKMLQKLDKELDTRWAPKPDVQLARELPQITGGWERRPASTVESVHHVRSFDSGPNKYEARFNEHGNGEHFFEFRQTGGRNATGESTYGTTGAGNAKETMTKAAAHFIHGVKNLGVTKVSFGGDTASRQKLYEHMLRRVGEHLPDYEISEREHPLGAEYGKKYTLTKKISLAREARVWTTPDGEVHMKASLGDKGWENVHTRKGKKNKRKKDSYTTPKPKKDRTKKIATDMGLTLARGEWKPLAENVPSYPTQPKNQRLSKVVEVPIEKLVPTEEGQDPEKIDEYKKEMASYAETFPAMVVDKKFNILDGHHRYHAAKAKGMTHVPVRIQLARDFRVVGLDGWISPTGEHTSLEEDDVDHGSVARRMFPEVTKKALDEGGFAEAMAEDHAHEQGYMKVSTGIPKDGRLHGYQGMKNYTAKQLSKLKDLGRASGRRTYIWTHVNGKPGERELKLARTKAPSGGMIVNNQFYQGGKFLPRALESIRSVRLRKLGMQAPVKLARPGSTEHSLWENFSKNPEDGMAKGILADHLDETGRPEIAELLRNGKRNSGIDYASEHGTGPWSRLVGGKPSTHPFLRRAHNGGSDQSSLVSWWVKRPDGGMHGFYTPYRTIKAAKATMGHLQNFATGEPVQLARYKLPKGAFQQKTLTDQQVRQIEKVHGLSGDNALPRQVNDDGTISTQVEHLAPFFDRLTKQIIGPDMHKRLLDDPGVSDDVKFFHLMTHTHKTAQDFMKGKDASEWYGSSVKVLEQGLKHLFARQIPGDPKSPPDPKKWSPSHAKLFKLLLALTSYNTAPINNTKNAVNALLSGYRHSSDRPFENIPDANYEALAPYRDLPPPGTSIPERMAWQVQYGSNNPGYMSAPIRVDAKGNVVGVLALDGSVNWSKPGFTKANTKPGTLPLVDEDGNLRPKTWGSMPADRVRKFKAFLHAAGGSYLRASKMLDKEYTPRELKLLFGLNSVNRGDLEPDAKIPGSYAFGPKFGAFYQNLSGNKNRITMDKWFSRTMARLVGGLVNNGKISEIPEGPTQRRLWKRVTEKASAKLGITPADMQAVLWFYEQNLWRLFGAKNRSEDFKDGIRTVLTERGFGSKKGIHENT